MFQHPLAFPALSFMGGAIAAIFPMLAGDLVGPAAMTLQQRVMEGIATAILFPLWALLLLCLSATDAGLTVLGRGDAVLRLGLRHLRTGVLSAISAFLGALLAFTLLELVAGRYQQSFMGFTLIAMALAFLWSATALSAWIRSSGAAIAQTGGGPARVYLTAFLAITVVCGVAFLFQVTTSVHRLLAA